MASGQGDTPLHDAARNGRADVVELLLAANAAVDVFSNGGEGWDLSSDATRSGPSCRMTVCLEIGSHRSFQPKSHLIRQVSTSSVSRNDCFDLRSLNNLVV